MKANDAHTDLFDRYLRGELPPGELVAFDRMLADDQDFAQSFEIHKILISGIQDHGRQELKNYLKIHTPAETGGNIWMKGKIWYAAAAVILAFVSIYAVVHFHGKDHPAREIALQEQNAPVFADTVNMALQEAEPAQKEMSPPVPERDMAMKEQALMDEVSAAPPMRLPMEQEIYLPAGSMAGRAEENMMMSEKSRYTILSEEKLADTLVTIPVLFALLEDGRQDKKDISDNAYNNLPKSRAKAKLPSNASNNNMDVQVNKTKDTLTDMVSGDAAKKLSTDKTLSKTLKIEYWQSPVNFKGYKYSGDLVQVYGLSPNNTRFYVLNNMVYLKSGTTIYALTLCADACPYRIETDQEIINFINRQE